MKKPWPLLLLVPLSGLASAEPPKKDFDEAEEQYSELWQNALTPGNKAAQAELDTVRDDIVKGDNASLDRAERKLIDVRKNHPEQPMAHYWTGRLYAGRAMRLSAREDREDETRAAWEACTTSLGKAHSLSPGLRTGQGTDDLHYQLASCAARAGKYELAETHLKQTLGENHDAQARVHLLFGELYMALGRLEEAVHAFRTTRRLRSPTDPEAHFALAVAFDRAERLSLAKHHLSIALKREPRFHSLWVHGRSYVPWEDQHYYLGLAYLARDERAWALYHWRRYLLSAPRSPWVDRAKKHYANSGQWSVGRDLEVKGTAIVDRGRAARAVRAKARAFQACVANHKELLLEVRITRYVPGAPTKKQATTRAARNVKAGIQVLAQRAHAVDANDIRRAQSCAQEVAETVAVPSPRGVRGTWASVEFMLISN